MKITKIEDIKDLKKFTGICLYDNGVKYWYKNGLKHREDGPAVEYYNGDKFWYLNGKYHRLDGPACEYSDGYKYWFLDGKQYSKQGYYKELYKLGKITEEELFLVLL